MQKALYTPREESSGPDSGKKSKDGQELQEPQTMRLTTLRICSEEIAHSIDPYVKRSSNTDRTTEAIIK